jgi:hypothetical protein
MIFYCHGVDAYNGSILVDNVSVSPVPEPSEWMLLVFGGAGLLALRARGKQSPPFAP